MSRQIHARLMTCLTLFLSLLACDLLQPTTTSNVIPTGVAGTRTAWAQQTAIAATLIAELPSVTRTPTVAPPIGTSTPVPPTYTPTRIPATGTPTSVSNFATVKGILVDGSTNEPLVNKSVVLAFLTSDGHYATTYNREGAPSLGTRTDSKGAFILQFDADWESTPLYGCSSYLGPCQKTGRYALMVDNVPRKDLDWFGMDGEPVTFEVKIGQTVDLGVVKLRTR